MTSLLLALFLVLGSTADSSTPSSSTRSAARAPEKVQGYLGIDFRWKRDAEQQRFLHVERVAARGPADQAGLRPADVITHIGGVPVSFGDELDFLIFMRDRTAGERLVMNIRRSGKTIRIVAVLGALPEGARAMWEQNFRIAQQKRLAAKSARP